MRTHPVQELLDIERIELDPVCHGFHGAVVELLVEGDHFVVRQTATLTGNPLLRFTTKSEELARSLFEEIS